MTELLAPVDIEAAVITLLGAAMTSVDFATGIPNPRPTRYGRITRSGGQARNLIQSDVRVLLEFFGPDETTAFQDAQMGYALLWAAQDSYLDANVYATQILLTEPVNFPDPDTKSSRYQFVATITTSLTEVSQ
jgi:hypothetical protein